MQSNQRTLLHRNGSIEVIVNHFATDYVFITFNEAYLTSDGHRFWGDTLFDKIGVSAIGIVTTEPNWYPKLDLEQAIRAINSHVGDRKVITYGHSQGGYGALKASAALNASIVIASGPQYSINPDDLEGNGHWYTKYYNRLLLNGTAIERDDLAGETYLLYDPFHETERYNINRILAVCPNLNTVIFPFSNHLIPVIISQSGRAEQFLKMFFDQGSHTTVKSLRSFFRSARNNSIYYRRREEILFNSQVRHPCWLLKSTASMPDGARCSISKNPSLLSIKSKLKIGSYELALDELTSGDFNQSDSLDWNTIHKLWLNFYNKNDYERELRVATLIPTLLPANCFARLHTVNSLIRNKRLEEAAVELTKIVNEFGPNNHADYTERFAVEIGDERLIRLIQRNA